MTDSNDAIPMDASDDGDDDGVNAFLSNIAAADEDRKKPAQEATDEAPEPDEETPEGEEQDEATDEEKGEEDKTALELGDDVKVKVKVNGEDTEFTLGDLKRLAGQEKALTQKSMEVAEARKGYDAQAQRAAAVAQKMLEKAEARYSQYKDLDYLKLSRTLDEATWDNLRASALEAEADVKFIQSELDGHMQALQQTQQADIMRASREAVAVLTGPEEKGGIPDFNPTLYGAILDHSVSLGVPRERAAQVTDPAAIRVMHKAMLYDQMKAAAKSAATKVSVAKSNPTKVAKPGAASGSSNKAAEALSRLAKTGSEDDAADAFLASFG